MNASELHDFDEQVDMMKAHEWDRVLMWPQLWSEFKTPLNHVWNWVSVPFEKSYSDAVPGDRHGVYTFAIAPGVAQHPLLYLVTYVGKADRMTLQARFLSYFYERPSIKRPQIGRFLRRYDGFIMFSFCPVADVSTIYEIENQLINTLIPPLCRRYPDKVSAARRAF